MAASLPALATSFIAPMASTMAQRTSNAVADAVLPSGNSASQRAERERDRQHDEQMLRLQDQLTTRRTQQQQQQAAATARQQQQRAANLLDRRHTAELDALLRGQDADANTLLADINSQMRRYRLDTDADDRQRRRTLRSQQSSLRAKLGASGVSAGEGSAAVVQENLARMAATDRNDAERRLNAQAQAYQNQMTSQRNRNLLDRRTLINRQDTDRRQLAT
mgnify:CR=1 FL=1